MVSVYRLCRLLSKRWLSMSHCHALCNVTSSVSSPSLVGISHLITGFAGLGLSSGKTARTARPCLSRHSYCRPSFPRQARSPRHGDGLAWGSGTASGGAGPRPTRGGSRDLLTLGAPRGCFQRVQPRTSPSRGSAQASLLLEGKGEQRICKAGFCSQFERSFQEGEA